MGKTKQNKEYSVLRKIAWIKKSNQGVWISTQNNVCIYTTSSNFIPLKMAKMSRFWVNDLLFGSSIQIYFVMVFLWKQDQKIINKQNVDRAK